MKDIIKYFKFIKFGLQLKLMCILGIGFFALGILFEVTDHGTSNLGALYIAISGLYVFQLVFSPSIAKLVQVSPYKKKIQTKGTALISLIFSLFTYTVIVAIRLIKGDPAWLEDQQIDTAEFYSVLLYAALILFILLIYMAISFKIYIVSLIICIAGVLGFMFVANTAGRNPFVMITEKLMDGNNPALLIVVCYAIILLGGLLCYVGNCLLFRREISHLAIRNALRQAQAK